MGAAMQYMATRLEQHWHRRERSRSSTPSCPVRRATASSTLDPSVLPSKYKRCVGELAKEVVQTPPPEDLDTTLRRAIAFCYYVTPEWSPHVRTTVFADNPSEHQLNVPVYETLLRTWDAPGSESLKVTCRAIPSTDVRNGFVEPSPFYTKKYVESVTYRQMCHVLFYKFMQLDDGDPQKQLLVNILLQYHEACYNCVGRHKEVFEYSIHDLLSLEVLSLGLSDELDGARRVILRMGELFLDRHKKNALHAVCISPLKFFFQNEYSVFENLDSHGVSFWSEVFAKIFPGLEWPFESITALDTGWSWGAVDFLPFASSSADWVRVLQILGDVDNLGQDWRRLTRGFRPPRSHPPRLAVGWSFSSTLASLRNTNSTLRRQVLPYVERFQALMDCSVILRRCCFWVLSSPSWAAAEGPALCVLLNHIQGNREVSQAVTPKDLQNLLCDVSDPGKVQVDIALFGRILDEAGVPWAALSRPHADTDATISSG